MKRAQRGPKEREGEPNVSGEKRAGVGGGERERESAPRKKACNRASESLKKRQRKRKKGQEKKG